jgi:hypothetical protein
MKPYIPQEAPEKEKLIQAYLDEHKVFAIDIKGFLEGLQNANIAGANKSRSSFGVASN